MELKKLLSKDFRSHQLFKQALTHRSYNRDHNERLEFLGDSVLQLLISEYLYDVFTEVPEGQLTRMRARLVRKETLSEIANKLDLRKWIKLGRGEKVDALSRSILANAIEAIIGALYLYQGLQPTWLFVKLIYAEHLEKLSAGDNFSDAKTRLQEYMQAHGYPLPNYEVKRSTMHGFEVVCDVIQGQAKGEGWTKREAEQRAAYSILSKIKKI